MAPAAPRFWQTAENRQRFICKIQKNEEEIRFNLEVYFNFFIEISIKIKRDYYN